ncbi:MAG: nucleotidyltransferase domain-containing protein [Firmicutes bacterium]|nr:nucleotidyltransferase domain-containing protein [Bacillota bacterium]
MGYRLKKSSPAPEQKEILLRSISNFLVNRPEIDFAYIHGSFVTAESFCDIDLAVYISEKITGTPLSYEINLEMDLEKSIKYPVDVRILNTAPLSFQYQVIKNGAVLFERDTDRRADFQTKTIDMYIDFSPFRKRYLKEVPGLEV